MTTIALYWLGITGLMEFHSVSLSMYLMKNQDGVWQHGVMSEDFTLSETLTGLFAGLFDARLSFHPFYFFLQAVVLN